MSKKIILLLFAFLAFGAVTALNTQNASAASCYDGNGHFYIENAGYPYTSFSEIGGDNEWSISTACGADSRGIMFITGSGGVWQWGNDYYFESNVWIDDYTTTLYMMGMIHNGYGAKNAYSVGICDGANASTCLYSYSHSARGIHVNNNAVTSVCGSFQRSTGSSWSSLGGWTQPTQSGKCAITFNLDGLRQSLADGSIEKVVLGSYTWEGHNIEIGRGTIYNTRCQTSLDSSCGGSGMHFLYDTSITTVEPKETTFTGDIDTYVGGTKYDDGDTINVTSSRVSIKFRDKVNRQGGGDYTQRACYSGWGTPYSNYSNHCHNFPAGYTSDYVDKTVHVSLSRGGSTTVCHTLYYPTKGREDNTGSDYTTTQECVTITRGSNTNDDCVSQMDSSFRKTDYVGKTDAWLIFRKNSTESITLKDGTTSHTYWAKPGDNIQYEYKLCGGSEYSRTADNEEPARGFGSSDRRPVFNITGKKDGSNNSSYLFGAAKSSYTSGSSDLKYYAGFTLPSNANYACHYAGGADTITNYYQIPAEAGRSTTCKSSSPTGPSDVGHTFSQEVAYRKVTTERYEVYHPCWDEDGDCSWYTYGTELSSSSDKTLSGTVKIPYNYSLIGMATHSLSKGVIYAGTNFVSSGQVKVLSRTNNVVNGSTAYATRTKNTTVKMISFTLDAGVNPLSAGSVRNGTPTGINTLCSVAAGGNTFGHCTENTASTEVLNDGNNQLTGGATKSMSSSFAVPTSVTPGMRVCTAIAYWPVDSHDTGNNSGITGESQDVAFRASGNKYAVSAPACVTVAKKPTFSVESSQAVTSGDVKTSMTTVGGRNYGSWSEYGIIAGGSVNNMASGAALGYQSHIFNTNLYSNINVGSPLASSGAPEAKTGCYISPQTMLNNNCSNIGGATRIISNYKGNEVAKKLADMYLMSDSKMASYSNESGMKGINSRTISINGKSPTINVGGKTYYNYYDLGDSACRYDTSTGKYYAPPYRSGNPYVRDNAGYHSPVFCTENGVKYYKVSGDVWMHGSGISANMQVGGAGTSDLGAGGSSSSYRNVTYVFDFRGTAIIDENMIINNAGYGDNFSTLDQLPTILIFADDVIITDNVTRLDAWIILGAQQSMSELSRDAHASTGYNGSGELNTCGASADTNSFSLISSYNSNVCKNQLIINSPVYAKKLTLRRNYGAQYSSSVGDNGYIQRGEIFNMRPDIYYWTYYQAQRNSILTTVFSRELPVRY